MEITLSYKSSKTNSGADLKIEQFLAVTVLLFIFTTVEPLQWQISDLITAKSPVPQEQKFNRSVR